MFLFEQNIIFSEAVGKKTQFTNPVYIHKAHIQVSHRGYHHLHKLGFSCGTKWKGNGKVHSRTGNEGPEVE